MTETMVAGLDGCPGGWVVATALVGEKGDMTLAGVERITGLDTVASRLESGQLGAAGVDIPIGLPDSGRRRCDVEARRMIGPRRSSVFPAPLRVLLGATTYAEAAQRCRDVSGRGLSRQVYGLLAKVGEVDAAMTPRRQRHLVEVHPEVSFTAMAGQPMAHYKKTPAGRAERLEALHRVFEDIAVHARCRPIGTGPDDVLDAFAVAWSAARWLTGTCIRLGGDRDGRGLRMEIIA